ncbi:MAG: hypothetical protein MJ025_05320, partial [Victivallaceae bacterium]|nr:hypothetical protein [Victivallaceae bacterium]
LARQTDACGKVLGGVGDAKRGTPGFVAPELYDNSGHPVTTSADIYALGALLYSLLTLSSPLAGYELNDILAKCAEGKVPPPSAAVPEYWSVPSALEAVAMKAMAPDPKDRYASVNELKNEIVAFMNGYAPMAEQANSLKKFELFILRHYAKIIIAMLTLMVISLLVILRQLV